MQRRKADAEGNVGPIRADRVHKAKSSCGGELEKQLARRTQLLDQVSWESRTGVNLTEGDMSAQK